jgi:hypothetical protein
MKGKSRAKPKPKAKAKARRSKKRISTRRPPHQPPPNVGPLDSFA